jgi:release factor glutamine methyltransferase
MGSRVATRVRLAEGDWFEALPDELRERIDLVVANPPYIAAGEVLPEEVAAWEPAGALVAGPTGLEDVARILADAPAWLARPGAVVVEIAPHQAEEAAALAARAGFDPVTVRPDLAGRLRVLVGRVAG